MRFEETNDFKAELLNALENCRRAENVLNYASEDDVIEFAVLELEAARKKYDMMLKRYKRELEAHADRGVRVLCTARLERSETLRNSAMTANMQKRAKTSYSERAR